MICIIGCFAQNNQNFTAICSFEKAGLSDRKSLLYPSPAFVYGPEPPVYIEKNHI